MQSAIRPLYCCIFVHANMSSRWKGRHSVSDRLTSSLFKRVGGSTKGGAVGEGPRSMTVLDTLIDPVEKGAITPN